MKKSLSFILAVLGCLLWADNLQAQNAVTCWKDGEPTIIYSPDSVFFWNAANLIPDISGEDEEGGSVEPTETEQLIMQLTSDEESAPEIVYSEEDSLKYDAMAQEVLAMFADDDDDFGDYSPMSRRKANGADDLAQDAIFNNGKNIFSDQLEIEQQNWNSGQWGKTCYGGFKTYYNTFVGNDGKRWLMVVFRRKGGFPNKKTAYLKLGQVNSGKILGKITIFPNREYVTLNVCIDDYLRVQDFGCVNFFPLLITESSQARNYLNPILVKTKPIVPDGWADLAYSKEFGKVNGVSVYCNTSGKKNQGDGYYQCVELCKRYVTKLFPDIKRPYGPGWGNAWNWPELRRDESGQDKGKYIVFANNGSRQVREGDLIVWRWQYWDSDAQKMKWTGHIAVVIKTTPKYISIAHQNGGAGANALPIGTTLKIENGIVKDIKPGYNVSPIFATSHPITHFIRCNHFSEDDVSYSASLTASTTRMEFGEAEVGTSKTLKFKIKNSGSSTLTVSSVELTKGRDFSTDASGCTVAPGEMRTFSVTFTPTRAGEFKDRITIQSDADDNPEWCIYLYGTGTGENTTVPTDGLVAYYPFNGNANDESGNGNNGTPTESVTLATGVHGDANGAYQFGGYDNPGHIHIPNSESLQFIEGATFSVYVKPTDWTGMDGWGNKSASGGLCVIAKDHDRTGMYFSVGGNDERMYVYGDGHGLALLESHDSLTGNYLNKWTHIAFVYGQGQIQLYVDGQLLEEKESVPDFSFMNSRDLYIGKFRDYWYPFNGLIDEVRIYNRALTESEVRALYEEPMK